MVLQILHNYLWWQKGLLSGKPREHGRPITKEHNSKNWKQVPHHLCMQVHSYACLSLWEDVGESNDAITWVKASIYGSKIEFDDGFHKSFSTQRKGLFKYIVHFNLYKMRMRRFITFLFSVTCRCVMV